MTESRLLKSCAMPPARLPMASIFWACRSCSSVMRRSASACRRSAISRWSSSFLRRISSYVPARRPDMSLNDWTNCPISSRRRVSTRPPNLPAASCLTPSLMARIGRVTHPAITKLSPMAPTAPPSRINRKLDQRASSGPATSDRGTTVTRYQRMSRPRT